jgi:rhamnulose-1-phosphate aldolase
MKLTEITQEIKEIAAFLVQKGWAERNAGNFSYRLDEDIPDSIEPIRHDIIMPVVPEIKNVQTFSISISNANSKFRDISIDVRKHCGILKVENENQTFYSQNDNQKPSSEANTHIEIHRYLIENHRAKRAVLHTHPTYLIALTHRYDSLCKDALNDLLGGTMPEVDIYIPRKTGMVDLLPPGSDELADATIKEFYNHDIVIWKKHGCIAVAETLWEAVDMIDILDKAAQIVLLGARDVVTGHGMRDVVTGHAP